MRTITIGLAVVALAAVAIVSRCERDSPSRTPAGAGADAAPGAASLPIAPPVLVAPPIYADAAPKVRSGHEDQEGQRTSPSELDEIERAGEDYALMVAARVGRLRDEGRLANDPLDDIAASLDERNDVRELSIAFANEDITRDEYNAALVEVLGLERASAYRAAQVAAGKKLTAEFYRETNQ